MKAKNLLPFLRNYYVTIQVVFSSGSREYTYLAPTAYQIQKGDPVIVDSPSSGLSIVTVTEVDPIANIDVDADFLYKRIVQKVDLTDYNEYREKEKEFSAVMLQIQREKRRAEAKEALRQFAPEGTLEGRLLTEDIIRILRIIEYVGPRSQVEAAVAASIHGTRSIREMAISAVTLGAFPEIMKKED